MELIDPMDQYSIPEHIQEHKLSRRFKMKPRKDPKKSGRELVVMFDDRNTADKQGAPMKETLFLLFAAVVFAWLLPLTWLGILPISILCNWTPGKMWVVSTSSSFLVYASMFLGINRIMEGWDE